MELDHVSRRLFVNQGAWIMLAIVLSGCNRTVTKYRADGTRYTVEESDPVGTLAAVLLGLLLLGVLAGMAAEGRSDAGWDDEEDGRHPRGDNAKVHLASARTRVSGSNRRIDRTISLVDSEGKLLASTDTLQQISLHDLETATALLKAKQVQNLQQPLMVRLQQKEADKYSIRHLQAARSPSDDEGKVFYRRVQGRLYRVKVRTEADNCISIEIARAEVVKPNETVPFTN